MSSITKGSEGRLPFDSEVVAVNVSRHFRKTWMFKWCWDQNDLRDALRDAYRVFRVGRTKWELFVRKKGGKKLIINYDEQTEEVNVITGAEG